MPESALSDILELESWTSYIQGFAGFTGDPEIISAFDWTEASQLTVGEYLNLIDEVEPMMTGANWTNLVNQVLAILDSPYVELTSAEKNEIRSALAQITDADIRAGFQVIRDEFNGIPHDTLVVDALGLVGGSGGGGGVGTDPTDDSDVLVGSVGSDNVGLGGGNDLFEAGTGDVGDDSIFGGAGNDTIYGGGGHDILTGGAGRDKLSGGTGADKMFGGGGNDRILGGGGNDTAIGGAGKDVLLGGAGNDRLRGDGGNDKLVGGGGADKLLGGSGDDVMIGGAGRDVLLGGRGKDNMSGGGGNDRLEGNAGADQLKGGAGNDTLKGGAGNDRLIGGAGDDDMHGGSGVDRFIFAGNFGDDLVRDFSFADGDLLVLSAFGFNSQQDVVNAMTNFDGSVELDINGQSIELEGISVADFQASLDSIII